jgi:hypothetical protein
MKFILPQHEGQMSVIPIETWWLEKKYPVKYTLNYSSRIYFLDDIPNDWGGFRMGTTHFSVFPSLNTLFLIAK